MTASRSAYSDQSHVLNGRIGIIASRQRGLITVWQLKACGVSAHAISSRVRSGRLLRVERGVYSLAGPVHDELTRRLAKVLACPPGSALGGVASIEARRFVRFRCDAPVIEIPRQCRVHIADAELRLSRAHAEGHVRTVHGNRVTSVPWAIARLGNELNAAQACHVIHQACWRGLTRLEDVEQLVDANPRWHGRGVVAAAIADYRAGSAGTRSSLEDDFVEIFEAVAGWTPRVNVHVDLGLLSAEVDVPLLNRGLLIEVDGPPHDEPPQRAKDQSRDTRASALGLHTERFHWRLIKFRRRECAARLDAVLRGHRMR